MYVCMFIVSMHLSALLGFRVYVCVCAYVCMYICVCTTVSRIVHYSHSENVQKHTHIHIYTLHGSTNLPTTRSEFWTAGSKMYVCIERERQPARMRERERDSERERERESESERRQARERERHTHTYPASLHKFAAHTTRILDGRLENQNLICV